MNAFHLHGRVNDGCKFWQQTLAKFLNKASYITYTAVFLHAYHLHGRVNDNMGLMKVSNFRLNMGNEP